MKISSRKLHYFNPGHEMAVWAGNAHYTPPAPVCRMMADLALLPLWYGEAGDYVLTGDTAAAARFLSSLPHALRPSVIPVPLSEATARLPAETAEMEAAPWGFSPQSIHLFESLRNRFTALAVFPWQEAYMRLTGRQTAAECLRRIQTLLPETRMIRPPRFCTTVEDIRQFMSGCPPPYVLKMPYSCSGRGLYWIRQQTPDKPALGWIEGVLKKQGEVSIEQALDKVCDFAMEFESEGNGQVHFRGLSVFDTLPRGTFSSCLLGSGEMLLEKLRRHVPETVLRNVQEAVMTALTEIPGVVYRGYLGMDMLAYRRRDGALAVHPAVELNLRHAMGWVALQLSDRWIHPASQGRFVIACDRRKGAALASHAEMEKTYPLQLEGQKIRAGYFSLCPVTAETHYRAYISAGDITTVSKAQLS